MNKRAFHPSIESPLQAAQQGGTIELDFGRFFTILRKGWWIIAMGGLAGGLIAAVLVLQAERQYTGAATLLMGQNSRSENILGALVQDLRIDDDAIAGEIAIISSGQLLSKVSENLDLARRPEFNPALRPAEPEPSLVSRLADLAVDQIKALIGIAPTNSEGNLLDTPTGTDPITDAALIGKKSLGEQADFVGGLQGGLRVRQVGNTNLVDIRYYSTDRVLAAAVPNAVADAYLRNQLDRKFDALRRVTAALETRLSSMRDRLEASERAVIEYRNRNLADGFGGSELLKQQLGDLSRRLTQASAELAELTSNLKGVDAFIETEGSVAAAGLFASTYNESALTEIVELQQRRREMIERFGDSSQQVQSLTIEIARLEASIIGETRRLRGERALEVDLAAARVDALRNQLRSLEGRAIEQAEREIRMTQLERDYAAEQAVYGSFLDKFTETNESMSLQEGDAQIVSYADPPNAPVSPNKKLTVALGGIGGIFAGLGLVFLRAVIDNSVRSAGQLRNMTSANILMQPRTNGFLSVRNNPLKSAAKQPKGPLSESIRSIRGHLVPALSETGGTVVSLVSTQANCGKSTTSVLLARSLAQMDVSCVIVETDLRAPSLSRMLGLQSEFDLVDVLSGRMRLEEALGTDPGSRAKVLSVRRGYNDPAGILLSKAMKDLVQDLRKRFQVVILDLAPLNPVSDALPMLRMSDQLIFMARFGMDKDEIQSGLELLYTYGPDNLTVVLSMTPRNALGSQSYAYY